MSEREALQAYRREAAREGSCNFCTRPVRIVTVVKGSTNVVIRFCDACLNDLRKQTR